ncbi:hypothetical protein C0989_002390 [Termitomyces sp. Mn162]|nr:hypothetical protein C0989_002390 [Termitomyces sp. Mn162]
MQMPWRHHSRKLSAPTPSLTQKQPISNRWRIGKDTYRGSLHALKQPHWPTNPPSTLLPPTLPAVNHPLAPFPAPPPSPWATPPTASDAPASPAPLTLALSPLALKCSAPAPTPPSPPMLHPDPPLPIRAPPPMLSTPSLKPPPANIGKPP